MIKNIAFKGAGVRGIAYVGALSELQKAGYLKNVIRVSGTSAGAMVSLMFALGYGPDDIYTLMLGLEFKKFKDDFNPIHIISHYGLYEGNYILEFAKHLLTNSGKGLTDSATFADMRKAGCRGLYIFATNLNTHSVVEFSADKTPGVFVAEAVRASMSIPVFFRAWQFSNNIPDDHIYVDGGLLFNYPLTFFDNSRFSGIDGSPGNQTIGLFLQSKNTETNLNHLTFDSIMHYSRHLFETLLDAQDSDFEEDDDQVHRSILIDDLGISSTNFDITEDDMNNLVNSGRNAALDFLSKNTLFE